MGKKPTLKQIIQIVVITELWFLATLRINALILIQVALITLALILYNRNNGEKPQEQQRYSAIEREPVLNDLKESVIMLFNDFRNQRTPFVFASWLRYLSHLFQPNLYCTNCRQEVKTHYVVIDSFQYQETYSQSIITCTHCQKEDEISDEDPLRWGLVD